MALTTNMCTLLVCMKTASLRMSRKPLDKIVTLIVLCATFKDSEKNQSSSWVASTYSIWTVSVRGLPSDGMALLSV